MIKGPRWAAPVGLAALALTACSVVAPNTSLFGLHYSGGSFSNQEFQYCVKPGERKTGGANDYDYFLPAGTRTISFGREGGEAGPISIKTRSNIEMAGGGTITFHVNAMEADGTTWCAPWRDAQGREWAGGRAQKLFDQHLRQREAFGVDDEKGVMPQAWLDFLKVFVVSSADRAADAAGQAFAHTELYNDAAARGRWMAAAQPLVQQYLNEQLGGDLIIIDNVQLDTPAVPAKIKEGFEAVETANLLGTAADVDKAQAESFPGGIAGYQAYQQQKAINEAIKDGKVAVLPVPYGSPVIVQGQR